MSSGGSSFGQAYYAELVKLLIALSRVTTRIGLVAPAYTDYFAAENLGNRAIAN